MSRAGRRPRKVVPFVSVRCTHCHGHGNIARVDGPAMRLIREQAGRGLREIADWVGVSAGYLSDMELGRRQMSEEIARQIVEACAK